MMKRITVRNQEVTTGKNLKWTRS